MKRKVEFAVGLMLLALMTQRYAHAAVTRHAAGTLNGSGTHHALSSPHGSQPHVPGYLGIGFQDAVIGHGIEVTLVDHDGPAGKSGLRPHDVILSLNGQSVNSTQFRSMIHEVAPGNVIALSVLRNGQTLPMKVQLADRIEVERSVRARVAAADTGEADPPVSEFVRESAADAPAPNASAKGGSILGSLLHGAPFTGLGLQTMEPQLAEYFGDTQGIGLLVQTVLPNSPAAFSGLHAGDVLLRADAVALKTSSDWSKRLRANQGQPMTLNVLREKREITVTLTPELKHHSLLEWPQLFGVR
jgi:serine protease Do